MVISWINTESAQPTAVELDVVGKAAEALPIGVRTARGVTVPMAFVLAGVSVDSTEMVGRGRKSGQFGWAGQCSSWHSLSGLCQLIIQLSDHCTCN